MISEERKKLIQAILDGKVLQRTMGEGMLWVDYTKDSSFVFNPLRECDFIRWRIKPENSAYNTFKASLGTDA